VKIIDQQSYLQYRSLTFEVPLLNADKIQLASSYLILVYARQKIGSPIHKFQKRQFLAMKNEIQIRQYTYQYSETRMVLGSKSKVKGNNTMKKITLSFAALVALSSVAIASVRTDKDDHIAQSNLSQVDVQALEARSFSGTDLSKEELEIRRLDEKN
jgi:hypothetical protein